MTSSIVHRVYFADSSAAWHSQQQNAIWWLYPQQLTCWSVWKYYSTWSKSWLSQSEGRRN